MVWGVGGLLRDLGAIDFAGGNVVHISSGSIRTCCSNYSWQEKRTWDYIISTS